MAERALTIGDVATRSGVSRRALRLYEACGIVPKPRRTQAGYRLYDADVLGILHFVTMWPISFNVRPSRRAQAAERQLAARCSCSCEHDPGVGRTRRR